MKEMGTKQELLAKAKELSKQAKELNDKHKSCHGGWQKVEKELWSEYFADMNKYAELVNEAQELRCQAKLIS